LSKRTIQITIIDDSHKPECDAACGVDWSSAETIGRASQQIKERFGERARLQYVDLAKTAANRVTQEWSEMIKGKNLSLPLLLLNGHPRISGEFDIRQLIDAIEAETEMAGR